MKTGMYKPFVKDGELWGKEVNPYGETEPTCLINCGCSEEQQHGCFGDNILWQQAEQSLQSFKVDEMEYKKQEWTNGIRFYLFPSGKYIGEQFKATLKDNTLINLEVL